MVAALNTADGSVNTSLHRKYRAVDFKNVLAKIDVQVPKDLDVYLMCDKSRPTSPGGERPAGKAPADPHAFHTDLFLLDPPGRKVLRLRRR